MRYKIVIIISLIIAMLLILGCQNTKVNEPKFSIAILMHCSPDDSRHMDAEAMKITFDNIGYEANIYYADKDSSIQNQQIQDAINLPVDAMIVSPISSDEIKDSLEAAKEHGILIISYDKLILNTDAVDYFASFDHSLIGIQQGLSLLENLQANGDGPYNIEVFAGKSNSSNNNTYFMSAMSVLQPLIDSGEIIVVSGQTTYEEVHDEAYKNADAGTRLENLISLYYSDEVQLHGILSPNDKMTLEFIDILNNNRDLYSKFPALTGQNAELKNIQAIISSKQSSTVFKDPYVLSQVAANMVIVTLNGGTPEINDSISFYNGVKTVPAYLCEPILITRDNYESVLIDTGYYHINEVFPQRITNLLYFFLFL